MVATSYVTHVKTYILHIWPSNIWHIFHICPCVGIFINGTYLEVACKVDITVGCIFPYHVKMMGIYAHLA